MGLKRTWIRPVDSRMDSLSKAYKQSDSLSQQLEQLSPLPLPTILNSYFLL